MKYSIIIPTLNEEVLLPKLLNQLADTGIRNNYEYEIIISDGGSTDKTLELAKKAADKIIRKPDGTSQNIAAGRNIGAKSASGEIFIFINGDVILSDVSTFFNYLEKYFVNSDYMAFTCDVWVHPDEEKFRDSFFHTIYNIYFYLLNHAGIGMGRGECQVIKRDTFYRVNGYSENYAAGEDFELFKRIRKIGKILFAKKVFVYESPRRFRKFGYVNVTFSWILNSISVMFKKRSINTEWEQVR